MQQPEAYIGNTMTLFNENNEIANPDTRKFLDNWLKSFEAWVHKFYND